MICNDYVLDVILYVNLNLGNTESCKAPIHCGQDHYSSNRLCRDGGIGRDGRERRSQGKVTRIHYIRYEMVKEYNYSTKKLLSFPTCGMCISYPSNSCLVGLKPYFLEDIIIPSEDSSRITVNIKLSS